MDIVEFLRARLDEDERDAIAIRDCVMFHGVDSDAEAEVIRLSSPDRVLREVEAHRRIVDLGWHHLGDEEYGWGMEEAKRQVLRIMATAYADHPDYDPEWR